MDDFKNRKRPDSLILANPTVKPEYDERMNRRNQNLISPATWQRIGKSATRFKKNNNPLLWVRKQGRIDQRTPDRDLGLPGPLEEGPKIAMNEPLASSGVIQGVLDLCQRMNLQAPGIFTRDVSSVARDETIVILLGDWPPNARTLDTPFCYNT